MRCSAAIGIGLGVSMSGVALGEEGPRVDGAAKSVEADRAAVFAARERDWRIGPVVYQVFVDRFAPSDRLEEKRGLYAPPRRLRGWDEPVTRGEKLADTGVWSHEIDFWGGDLASVAGRLEYIESLGVDAVYLNPIHEAYTNHKYDALDFAAVSPEYGTRGDVAALADALHDRGLKLILDGVFNHMGLRAPAFERAMADESAPERDWFYIDSSHEKGYRSWANVANLPELRIEHPAVAEHVYAGRDSVVRSYLREEGVDGWRLDVAYDLGLEILGEITEAAHAEKAESVVVGEIWNYPEEWFPSLDGVMNFHLRRLIREYLAGRMGGGRMGQVVDRMIGDSGIEPILRSWVVLDNHDTSRLVDMFEDERTRRLAQVLQFTLPGAPCLYYGTELGMEGDGDPMCRGPMRWDLVGDGNETLAWTRTLLKMRRAHRALRIGDWRVLDTERVFAFTRRTESVRDFVLVVVNASDAPVRELFSTRESKLMSYSKLVDVLDGGEVLVKSGTLSPEVAARSARVFVLPSPDTERYSPYGRVR